MEEQRYLFETSKADSEIRFQALSELEAGRLDLTTATIIPTWGRKPLS